MIKIINITPHSQTNNINICKFITYEGVEKTPEYTESDVQTIGLPASITDIEQYLIDNNYDKPPSTQEEEAFLWSELNADSINQQRVNDESLRVLKDTDWYVTRLGETGKAIPNDILQARQVARDSIKDVIYTENN